MNRLRKYWKEFNLTIDVIISILGIALIIFLVLSFLHPERGWILLATFLSGGSINILNGLKIVKDNNKKTIAMSYILFGFVIILLGFIIAM